MKKEFYTLLAGVIALASCSKSDETPNQPQSGEQLATFSIAAPPVTRGEVTGLSRYIVEAYEDNDLAATPQRVEEARGSLTLALKKNTEYTFVFWSDYGTAKTAIATSGDYYDATSLLDVKVNSAAYATIAKPAYALAVKFNSKDFEAKKAVTLKNATAQLNFVDTEGLAQADNSLTVKYSSGGKLNVATGAITEISSEISRTYTNIGMVAKDVTLVTDYILAPLNEKRLLDLKVAFNAEAEKTITGVPFQQSYKTNIKGEYSNFYSSVFTITTDEEWLLPENDVEFGKVYKMGDIYPNATSPIGVVFWVDEIDPSYNSTDKTSAKGKIVSLDEVANTQWSIENMDTGATSGTDGAGNTVKVLALDSYKPITLHTQPLPGVPLKTPQPQKASAGISLLN